MVSSILHTNAGKEEAVEGVLVSSMPRRGAVQEDEVLAEGGLVSQRGVVDKASLLIE